LEQVTVDPGGTTMVVFLGGGDEWLLKLRQPAKPIGRSATSTSFFMQLALSGRHCIQMGIPRGERASTRLK
jgi:hypothetical protein